MEPIVRKYKSFALTLRPRDGITGDQISVFVKWCKSKCDYYFIGTEKEDHERHIHAGVFMKEPTATKVINQALKRLMKGLDEYELKTLCRGTKIMYNIDFIEQYIGNVDKGDAYCLIESNLPETKFLEGYWPPKVEQRKAMAEAAVDKFYAKLERLWYECQRPGVDVNRETVTDFLFDMMYKSRKIRVLRDDKAIKQTAMHFERYISKMSKSNISYAPWE